MAEDLDIGMEQLEDEDYDFLDESENSTKEDDQESDDTVEDNSDKSTDDSEKEDKLDKEDKTTETGDKPSDKNLSLFASALAEEGIISDLSEDDSIKNFDDLAKAIQKEIKNNEYADLTDDQKEFLDKLKNGYTVKDYEEVKSQKLKDSDILNLNEDSLSENEELQKKLIKEDFISKGYSEEKAENLSQRSFDIGENEKDAIDALKERKANKEKQDRDLEEQKEKNIKQREQEAKEIKEKLESLVYNEDKEILPGVKFNKNVADSIYESMTKPVEVRNDRPISKIEKSREENPLEFEKNLHAVFHLTKGFKDFSIFKDGSGSKKSKQFIDSLESGNTSTATNPSRSYSSDEDVDLDFIEENLT